MKIKKVYVISVSDSPVKSFVDIDDALAYIHDSFENDNLSQYSLDLVDLEYCRGES